MPAGGSHLRRLALLVHGVARQPDARGRLQCDADQDILARGYSTEDSARRIAPKTGRRDFIPVLRALLGDDCKSRAKLDSTNRIDAHHRVGDVRLELVEHRFAETCRDTTRHHVDACTDGIALLAQRIHIGLKFRYPGRVGAKKRVVVYGSKINDIKDHRTQLPQVTANLDAKPQLQELSRNGASRHTHGRLARRRTAPAPVVADAVFLLVRVVGVARPESILDLSIVLGLLVHVFDQQADRRAGGQALEHAGENLHRVRLTALGGVPGLAGAPALQIPLDVSLGKGQAGRTPVDDAAQCRPVALAEGRDRVRLADGIAGHLDSTFLAGRLLAQRLRPRAALR